MNKRRLLKLADLLEADAKNKKGIKFDLSTWAAPSTSDLGNAFRTKEKKVSVDCGTTACAVGLACISGVFAKSGLTHSYRKSFLGKGFVLVPKFDGLTDFRAVAKFFGLDSGQSYFLFSASDYPDDKTEGAAGERYVAKRIRDFVAGKVQRA